MQLPQIPDRSTMQHAACNPHRGKTDSPGLVWSSTLKESVTLGLRLPLVEPGVMHPISMMSSEPLRLLPARSSCGSTGAGEGVKASMEALFGVEASMEALFGVEASMFRVEALLR